jgi:hypothetical protein
MDMHKRGWTTIAVTVGPRSTTLPKGGTYDRLEQRLKYRKQSWDEVVSDLLDIADTLVDNGK